MWIPIPSSLIAAVIGLMGLMRVLSISMLIGIRLILIRISAPTLCVCYKEYVQDDLCALPLGKTQSDINIAVLVGNCSKTRLFTNTKEVV